MTVLVTGAAGFIGFHVCSALLARGEPVIGVDCLDPYYDVALKEARVAQLAARPGFTFARLDICDREGLAALIDHHSGIDRVIHLAAQAGVRYSLINPFAYTRTNVEGHLAVLEACRRLRNLRHVVFASSSSVYGANTKLPFSVKDRVDSPLSLYAASKRAAELISISLAGLHGLPQSGLRFFTVYGPWGRPDMAAFIFTRKILADEPIPLFNQGRMRRDFTYIDDIVAGVLACLDRPPSETPPMRLYNLGNRRSEPLTRFIEILETALGRKARLEPRPLQPGDVPETCADIDESERDFGFAPRITIDEGLPRFVRWYREYHRV